ncbi:hypothetical protein ACLM5J_14810 [Nocardioides sp. Bht2]|uniref:hypothetical protein n=1 Tax=Nocardioides sp. Bht2 TaxID=3392297 RepID=UPI0039B477A9
MAAVVQAAVARDFAVSGFGDFIRASLRSPAMLLVVGAYLVGFVLHAVSVVLLPLYLAQACVAFSMPVTAVCSARVFHEPLGRGRLVGVGAVCLGIALLAFGAGEPGPQIEGWSLPLGLAALLAVCVVGGLLLLNGKDAVALGALAGLGYAGSALAMRGVGTELTGPTILSALLLPIFGLIAFWLYSVSMSRADVTPATGAMIVNQTFVPAVVGLLLMGDSLHPDGVWLAVAGLSLGTLGAIRLSPRLDAL